MVTQDIYYNIFNNSLEQCLLIDGDGNIIHSNSAAKKDLGIEDSSQINIKDVFRNDIEDIESGNFFNSFETIERTVYRKNLTCFQADTKVVFSGTDEFPYVVYIHNIAIRDSLKKEVARAKAESQEASKVKTEFVANVTHELRTPVNGILGNTRILLENETDPEKLNTLHTIETGCNVMHSLINNILDFSKLDSGKFTLENREFEFQKMIDFVRSNHEPKITEKGLDFIISISPDIPERIIGDELRIGQILNNLLSNATKFTSVGNITLQAHVTSQKDNRIELFFMVIDTGIGVDKSDQDKLFQSFTQVDASISRQFGGTGLGLNISKQLVNMMGGDIKLESEKGKGSLFSFNIWVEVPEDETISINEPSNVTSEDALKNLIENSTTDQAMSFGTDENIKKLSSSMDKLILCIEMSNWAKAETFANTVKNLTNDAPKEVKTSMLRLKMAVQKSDYDKAVTAFNTAKEELKFYINKQ